MKSMRWILAGLTTAALFGMPVTSHADGDPPKGPPAPLPPPVDSKANSQDLADLANAKDPSAAIDAYARASAAAPHDVAVPAAYLRRMVEFGLPEMAERQAQDVKNRDPGNALAWAVLAFNEAKREETKSAVGDILSAVARDPNDVFVQRTAAQIAAWVDLRADKTKLDDPLKASVEKMKKDLAGRPAYAEALKRAQEAYAQDDGAAASGTPLVERVPQDPPPPPAPAAPLPLPSEQTSFGTAPVVVRSEPVLVEHDVWTPAPVETVVYDTTYVYDTRYVYTDPFVRCYVPRRRFVSTCSPFVSCDPFVTCDPWRPLVSCDSWCGWPSCAPGISIGFGFGWGWNWGRHRDCDDHRSSFFCGRRDWDRRDTWHGDRDRGDDWRGRTTFRSDGRSTFRGDGRSAFGGDGRTTFRGDGDGRRDGSRSTFVAPRPAQVGGSDGPRDFRRDGSRGITRDGSRSPRTFFAPGVYVPPRSSAPARSAPPSRWNGDRGGRSFSPQRTQFAAPRQQFAPPRQQFTPSRATTNAPSRPAQGRSSGGGRSNYRWHNR